ncbi:MAG: LuxR C-terminal-related transcriptional regulator [Pseudomonadales bacterium]
MSNNKSQIELLDDISHKLDTVIGFLAARDINDPAAVVEKLVAMGMDNKTIAPVAGITENAVSIRRTRLKKKIKKSTKSD